MKKRHVSILMIVVMVLACIAAAVAVPCIAADDRYVEPAFLVDFNDKVNVAKCFDSHAVAGVHDAENQAMKMMFADTSGGMCDDPYLNFALPTGLVDVAKYHYLAMLIKTDYTAAQGEIRLRSGTTDNNYPFFRFNYSKTEDWQVIVVDLTDMASVGAYPQNGEISGALSNLRLDMFNNRCATDVNYYVKAYGLYERYADATTFKYFESEVTNEPVKPDVDYSQYWRGTEFYEPANPYRMNWLAYGFDSTYKVQVNSILSRGYGGIVSNVNFNQNYLKDEDEFTLLRNTYLFAKEKDMTLWIYDEYQWPSGSAYGQVLDTNPDWRAKGIEHICLELDRAKYTYTPREGIDLEIVLATLSAGDKNVTLTPDGASLSFDLTGEVSGACTLHVYVLRYTDDHEEDRTDFSTLYHVDTLRKDSVARFIELTHLHYKNSFGKDFDMVEAFFTDEPSQGNRDMENYIVWTDGLDETFKQRYGYELALPALFEGNDEVAQRMRIHYYSLVADLFKQSYIDQIADWCEQNGTISSGHLLFEENMNDHVETYGGDFMQVIGGMTMPGVDILWVHPNQLLSQCFVGNHLGIRFVASAARNAGKADVMVEYNPSAVPTDDFNNDKMGASIGGVTLTRLLGTTVYNVINPQHDYTLEQINALNTYVGRLNVLLEGTVEAGDLAVFYPIATVQALHNADDVHSSAYGRGTEAVKLNDNYTAFCLDLLQRHVLYTVIDDQSICAATVTADGRLVIGNGSYRTLVLAYGQYISAEAAEKLAAFKQAGGTVVFVGTTYKDYKAMRAEGGDRVSAAMESLSDCDNFALITAGSRISKMASRSMKLTGLDGLVSKTVLLGEFFDANHDITYVANTTAINGKGTLEFTDGYEGAYTVYYPYSGNIESGSGNEVKIDLPAYCAVLIVREDSNVSDDTPFVPEGSTDSDSTEPGTTEPDTTESDSTESGTTEAETEPQTQPEQTTAEQTSTAPAGTTEDVEQKQGCKSALGVVPLTVTAGAALVLGKKKKK